MQAALIVGREVLDDHAHRCSPRKFTQPQLFACLVLKTRLKLDYRGTEALLRDTPGLCACISMSDVPHFTTLHKAARRLLRQKPTDAMLEAAVAMLMRRRRRIKRAAVDSSGFESTHASRYYIWRAKQRDLPRRTSTYRGFMKLGVICDCRTHMIVSSFTTRGPSPDVNQLGRTFERCVSGVKIDCLLADAGYDSEANHVMLREYLGIRSVIPPTHGRPRKDGGPPSSRWRRLMALRFDKKSYNQRSQVETVFSMIKRNLDPCLRSRSYWSKKREIMLKVLTHNIAILRRNVEVFYRAG